MSSLQERLAAGLEAQDWIETASRSSSWRRFAKWTRGAMYIMLEPSGRRLADDQKEGQVLLWFSPIAETEPNVPVYGPIYEQVLAAGDKWLAQETPDTTALLIELLDVKEQVAHSDCNDKNGNGDEHT